MERRLPAVISRFSTLVCRVRSSSCVSRLFERGVKHPTKCGKTTGGLPGIRSSVPSADSGAYRLVRYRGTHSKIEVATGESKCIVRQVLDDIITEDEDKKNGPRTPPAAGHPYGLKLLRLMAEVPAARRPVSHHLGKSLSQPPTSISQEEPRPASLRTLSALSPQHIDCGSRTMSGFLLPLQS